MTDIVPERPAAPALAGTGAGAALVEVLETPETAEAFGLDERRLSPTQLAIRRFMHHRLAMISLCVLVTMGVMCGLAPLLAKHGYAHVRGVKYQLLAPGRSRLFGTDFIGRDMWARVLYGGRVSLMVGLGVAISATFLGTTIGALAGYKGGRIDNFLMRITDLFLAMPLLVILILASKALGGSV